MSVIVFPLGSVWELVERQSFSFSKKRSFVCAENQGEMSYEGSPVKAPLYNQKKDDAAHAAQQIWHSSTDES